MMRFLLHIALFAVSIIALRGMESPAEGHYVPRHELLAEESGIEQLQWVLEQAVALPVGSFESPTSAASTSVRIQVKPTSSRHHTWGMATPWQENRTTIHHYGGQLSPQAATTALVHCEPCWLCRLII